MSKLEELRKEYRMARRMYLWALVDVDNLKIKGMFSQCSKQEKKDFEDTMRNFFQAKEDMLKSKKKVEVVERQTL